MANPVDYSQYINPVQRQMAQNFVPGAGFDGGTVSGGTPGETDAQYNQRLQDRNGMIQQALGSGALNADQIDQLLKQGDIQSSQVGGDYWKSVAERNKSELDRQTKQLEIDKKRGFDENGRPIKPDFTGIADDQGHLKDGFKMSDWQNVNANTDAMNKYSQTALRDPKQASEWAQLMNDQIGANTAAGMDNASQQGANSLQQMQSELAQNGGLSGPARERMANQSMRQQLMAKQGVQRQGAMDKMNVATQDESNRMNQLGALQTMQNQQADIAAKNQQYGKDVEKFNTQNSINNQEALNMYNLDSYKSNMADWGAGKSADAQARAARSSGGKK